MYKDESEMRNRSLGYMYRWKLKRYSYIQNCKLLRKNQPLGVDRSEAQEPHILKRHWGNEEPAEESEN